MSNIGHFVRNNQMVFRIYSRLNVVADHTSTSAAGGHGTSIRIGLGKLLIRLLLQTMLNFSKILHLLPELDQLFL
jgi:hypothetical protein